MNNYKVYHRQKFVQKRPVKKTAYLRKFSVNYQKIVVVFLIVGIGITIWNLLFKSTYFSINNYQVTGTKEFVNESDLKTQIESNTKNKNLVFLKTSQLENLLESNFKGAKSIHISKDYPNSINVVVEERVPLAVLYNSEAFLIDESGYVLGLVDPDQTNLPKIKFEEKLVIGEHINPKMIPLYLDLVNSLDQKQISVSSISLTDKDARIFLGYKGEALIDLNKSISESVGLLNQFLKEIDLEGKQLKKIDLRYDKVVVSFE